jgi:hypothetical protein
MLQAWLFIEVLQVAMTGLCAILLLGLLVRKLVLRRKPEKCCPGWPH